MAQGLPHANARSTFAHFCWVLLVNRSAAHVFNDTAQLSQPHSPCSAHNACSSSCPSGSRRLKQLRPGTIDLLSRRSCSPSSLRLGVKDLPQNSRHMGNQKLAPPLRSARAGRSPAPFVDLFSFIGSSRKTSTAPLMRGGFAFLLGASRREIENHGRARLRCESWPLGADYRFFGSGTRSRRM